MSDNPYTAPSSSVDMPKVEVSIPADVLKQIKQAWIAGVISGAITLGVTLLAIFGKSILGFGPWELLDVALVFGLAFGIYKKSRTCAVLMLVYFIAAKILIMMETGKLHGSIMSLVFIYFYWQGISGTFAYHRLLRAQRVTGIPAV